MAAKYPGISIQMLPPFEKVSAKFPDHSIQMLPLFVLRKHVNARTHSVSLSQSLFLSLSLSGDLFCIDVVILITKTCLYNIDPLKPHFYMVKLGFTGVYIIFLISAQNIHCGYSLEPPR